VPSRHPGLQRVGASVHPERSERLRQTPLSFRGSELQFILNAVRDSDKLRCVSEGRSFSYPERSEAPTNSAYVSGGRSFSYPERSEGLRQTPLRFRGSELQLRQKKPRRVAPAFRGAVPASCRFCGCPARTLPKSTRTSREPPLSRRRAAPASAQPTEIAPTNLSVGAQHAVPGATSPKNT
jgi:hypothetical protein